MRAKRPDLRIRHKTRVAKITLVGAAVLLLLGCTAVDLPAYQPTGEVAQSGAGRPADDPMGAEVWGLLIASGLLALFTLGPGKGDRQRAAGFTDACRFFFEEAPSANIILSSNGNITELNGSALAALGHAERSELIGRSILGLVVPEHRVRLTQLLEDCRQDVPPRAKVDLLIGDGSTRTFLFSPCRVTSSERESPADVLVAGVDVTHRESAGADELRPAQQLEFLSETAMGFLELSPQEDVHRYMGERLKQLVSEAAYIVVNSVDRERRKLQVRCVLGSGKLLDLAAKAIGRNPAGMSFDVQDEAWQGLAGGKLVRIPDGLYELAFGQVPKAVCGAIEKLANLGDIYVMGFAAKNEVYGSAAILLRRGVRLTNQTVIETFIRQAGVALQRRQAEEALQKEREKLEWATENAGVGLVMISKDYRTLWANQVIKRIFGEVEEKPCHLSYHQRAEVCPGCGVKDLFETGKDQVMHEQVGKDKQGRTTWLQIMVTPVRDTQGNVTAALEAVVPITERKQNEILQAVLYRIANAANTAQDLDELFRIIRKELMSVLDTTNFFVALYDKETKTLSLPYHVDERDRFASFPPGKTLTAWILRNDSPLLCTPKLRRRLLDAGEIEQTGTPSLAWLGVPLKVDSETIGVLGVQSYNDPSAYGTRELEVLQFASEQIALAIRRKQTEQALRESEERFRRLSEAAFEAIAIHEGGVVLSANDQYFEMFRYESNELLGKQVMPLTVAPEARESMRKQIATGGMGPYESIGLRKDGSKFPMEIRVREMEYEGRTVRVGAIMDITERKQAEEVLEKEKERYRNLFETAPDSITTLDTRGFVASCNVATEKLAGYPIGELVGRHFTELGVVGTKELPRYLKLFGSIIRGKLPEPVEVAVLRKDGTIRQVEAHISLLREGGRITGIQVISHDITERKRAERALRQSEERFRIASQIASDVVYERDLKTGMATFYGDIDSPLGYELGGYPHTMEGWRDHVHPEDLARIDNQKLDQLEPGLPYGIEYRMRKKDGTYMTWSDRIMIIRDKKTGEPLKFIGAATDITERKRTEEALRKSEERYRAYVENAPDGIFIADSDARYVDVNQAACRMTGYSRDELLNMDIMQLAASGAPPPAFESFQELKRNGRAHSDIIIRKKDGSLMSASLDAVALSDGRYMAFCSDITERKRAEEASRQSQAKLQSIFSAAPAGIGMTVDQTLKELNSHLCEMTGYTKEELLGRSIDVVYPSDEDYQRTRREIYGKLAESDRCSIETRWRRKDGGLIYVLLNCAPLQPGNLSQGITFTVLDITERKRAEEDLKEAYDIINRSPTVAFLWRNDEGWSVEFVSDNVKELFGYTAEEFISGQVSYAGIVHPDDLKRVAEEVAGYGREEGREDFVHQPYRIVTKSGEVKWIDDRTHIRRNKEGSITHYQGVVQDVTERKGAEEALRESEERIRTLADASFEAIVIHEDGELLRANDQFFRMFGYEAAELLGTKPIPLLIAPESVDLLQSKISSGSTDTYEIVGMKKDGTTFPAEIHGRAMEYHGRRVRVASMRDLSERKKMEAHLIQAERLAAVGTLAYGIAHEFNNIVAGILGNAEFGTGNDDPKEVEECFRVIMENCDRARSITNHLLAFGRQRKAKKEITDLTDTVENVLGLIERELQKENINVKRDFNPVPEIFCDPGELSEVFLNMITNARDAMRPGGGTLTISMGHTGDDLRITFADTGCGIPDAIKGRIFEPFVTTKGALGQSEIPGTGLGLFLSIGVISGYHGQIEVESREGKGSAFTISMPVSENQLPPDEPQDSREKTTPIPRNLRILLVDDEEPICSATKNNLEADGHSVVSTTSGEKGLKLFKAGAFDLVLSDITMPDMDGIALISSFRTADPRVKLVVLTGHIQGDKLAAAKRAGADQILIKPFKKEDLLRTMNRVLASDD